MANLNVVIDAMWNGRRVVGGAEDDIKGLSKSVDQLGIESSTTQQKQAELKRETEKLADAVRRGDKNIEDATGELRQYRTELGLVDNETGNAGTSFASMAGKMAGVTAGFAAVAAAAVVTYKAIGEGASLIAAEEKFGALAGSIGTTADALLSDMRRATGYMVSDADLIVSATDIINTGLGNTHDETVRLAKVIGTLGLDMETTILTFANNSKARLDSMGLSISDVNEKTKEFQATGMNYDQAFDAAVLTLLEEKVILYGDAADTTAGQMDIFAASMDNLKNAGKVMVAQVFAPMINSLASTTTSLMELDDAIARGIYTAEEYNAVRYNLNQAEALEVALGVIAEREKAIRLEQEAAIAVEEEAAAAMEGYSLAIMDVEDAFLQLSDTQSYYTEILDEEKARILAHAEAVSEAIQAEIASQEAIYTSFKSTISGVSASVAVLFDGSADASEGSMARQVAANEEISASYKAAALVVVESKLSEALAQGGIEGEAAATAILNMQVALGTITQDEADKLQEIADTTARIQEATEDLTEVFLADGELTREESEKIALTVEEIEKSFLNTKTEVEKTGAILGDFDSKLLSLPEEVIVRVVTEYSTRGSPSPYSGAPGGNERGLPEGSYAAGGYVIEDGSYIVGETGPERVTLPVGAHVTNAHDMRTQTYNFSTNNVGVVMAQLERQQRRHR